MTRILLFVVIAAVACGSGKAPSSDTEVQRAASAAATVPPAAAPDWLTYDAGNFTILYPPNAKLVQARSHPGEIQGMGILGPQIHVPVSPDVGPSAGPAYQLIMSTFPNPGRLSTQVWVDRIRRQANSGPMDSDSLTFLQPADTVFVGGLQFLRLEPFCGDCEPEELYLAHGDRIAVASYVFDTSFPGDRDQQRKTYLAMLNTFRWKK